MSNEPEHRGPIWKHPYFLYVLFTAGLFVFLLLLAWVANESDWIPKR